MSLDRYKKRMQINGGSISNERAKDNRMSIIDSFEDCPSYRRGLLKKIDYSEEEVEIRVVNIDKTTYEKKMYFLPNDVATEGDYVFCDNKHYLISEFEDNLISPYAKVTECKQTLKWRNDNGDIKEYPCVVSYQSYGVKLFQAASDLLSQVSTNVDITVQRNEDTDKIPLNTRFMFGNSENGIYTCGDIATYEAGIIKLTCKKTSSVYEDDIQNNLAFNGNTIPEPETQYTIVGSQSIKVNTQQQYTITPQIPVTWEIDNSTIARIDNQDSNSCTVTALKVDEIFVLYAKQGDKVIDTIVVETGR